MLKHSCDLHMHTSFSADSDAPMETMIRQAVSLGLDSICFTEHLDLDFPVEPEELAFDLNLEAYRSGFLQLREQYACQIEILYGIELGMQMHLPDRYGSLIKTHPFDFVIASQHLVDGKDPYPPSFWLGRDEEETYRTYFRSYYENLKAMPDFDTAAHLDYIVRYGPNQNRLYNYEAYADVIDPILALVLERGKSLEVNTAGLKYGLGQTNPAEDVLRRYYQMGGRYITLGSDAHSPEHIGWQFTPVRQMLRDIGFTSLSIYRSRQRCDMPL